MLLNLDSLFCTVVSTLLHHNYEFLIFHCVISNRDLALWCDYCIMMWISFHVPMGMHPVCSLHSTTTCMHVYLYHYHLPECRLRHYDNCVQLITAHPESNHINYCWHSQETFWLGNWPDNSKLSSCSGTSITSDATSAEIMIVASL